VDAADTQIVTCDKIGDLAAVAMASQRSSHLSLGVAVLYITFIACLANKINDAEDTAPAYFNDSQPQMIEDEVFEAKATANDSHVDDENLGNRMVDVCMQNWKHKNRVKEHQRIDQFFARGTLKDEVMKIPPMQKMTSAEQCNRFACYVLFGDQNDHIGLGAKCAKEMATTFRGGIITSKMLLSPVRRGYWSSRTGLPHTVLMKVHGKWGSVRVRLLLPPLGSGVVGSPVCKKMLQFISVADCFSCSCGNTKTKSNFMKATFEALSATYFYLTPDLHCGLLHAGPEAKKAGGHAIQCSSEKISTCDAKPNSPFHFFHIRLILICVSHFSERMLCNVASHCLVLSRAIALAPTLFPPLGHYVMLPVVASCCQGRSQSWPQVNNSFNVAGFCLWLARAIELLLAFSSLLDYIKSGFNLW